MSHKLHSQSLRARVTGPDLRLGGQSLIPDSLQAQETGFERACGNPLCSERFPEGGMPQSPKRFCDDDCLQKASILRRAGKLLENETDKRALEVLRGKS